MLTPRLRSHTCDPSVMQTSPEPSSSVTGLKRSRALSEEPMVEEEVPPQPKLTGPIIVEVFTHKSLRIACGARYRDNERLSILGKQVLDMITTQLLFFRKPNLKAEEIRAQKQMLLNDETIDIWSKLYRMRDELRCDPLFLPNVTMPEQGRLLFDAYLGAVFEEHGLDVVQEWIGALLRLSTNLLDDQPFDLGPPIGAEQSAKKIKLEDNSMVIEIPPPPLSSNHNNPYVQPTLPPGPPPFQSPSPPRSLPNPLAPAQPNIAFLPLFNQTATHRGVTVNYPATFTGPPHARQWIITCVVNGIEKGKGSGTSKQLAREQAARAAYYAMGWAPRG
ncbi:hypothetical protein BJ138DRAFT_1064608 [Hygrophoropsis aurantiaca]|uniref:Uncharacterized protein n=1 Tax=Hygrophoropsis aurantiaca TaxID=72124 RepID=A0ACB8AC45_9AGAM|nr:hypothetical protein BJ138DRAFT_1064608 [Hygrophoropsis aurantiaca]